MRGAAWTVMVIMSLVAMVQASPLLKLYVSETEGSNGASQCSLQAPCATLDQAFSLYTNTTSAMQVNIASGTYAPTVGHCLVTPAQSASVVLQPWAERVSTPVVINCTASDPTDSTACFISTAPLKVTGLHFIRTTGGYPTGVFTQGVSSFTDCHFEGFHYSINCLNSCDTFIRGCDFVTGGISTFDKLEIENSKFAKLDNSPAIWHNQGSSIIVTNVSADGEGDSTFLVDLKGLEVGGGSCTITNLTTTGSSRVGFGSLDVLDISNSHFSWPQESLSFSTRGVGIAPADLVIITDSSFMGEGNLTSVLRLYFVEQAVINRCQFNGPVIAQTKTSMAAEFVSCEFENAAQIDAISESGATLCSISVTDCTFSDEPVVCDQEYKAATPIILWDDNTVTSGEHDPSKLFANCTDVRL